MAFDFQTNLSSEIRNSTLKKLIDFWLHSIVLTFLKKPSKLKALSNKKTDFPARLIV